MADHALWVVIPFFNEEAGIEPTLRALLDQTDRAFTTLLVNNGSTDGTMGAVTGFLSRNPSFHVVIVDERQNGTGAAADTGFRYAIAHGARWILRTDADCLPDPNWVRNARRALEDGLLLVSGRIVARKDDYPPQLWERTLLPSIVYVAATFGRVRPGNRGSSYRCPYIMTPRNNLAIDAGLYLECGGFSRTSIEDIHEDRELVNRVRLRTDRIGYRKDMVVANSLRRLRAYGLRRTLLWYWDHRYRPALVDVR
jgi:glycosyltransferase involved in cell wall biosynthesis